MEVPQTSSPAELTTAMALLHAAVRRHLRISDEELARFSQPFRTGSLRRRAQLLQPGQVCAFEAFVTKGCLYLYALNARGQRHVLYFATEGWWVTDIDSFVNQAPSRLYVEALEDSEFLLIGRADKEQLYREVPATEQLFRLLTQKTHVVLQRRLLASFSDTAAERYEAFLATYPELARRLTQQHIAAYLGVSHEFISKIRKHR